MADLSQTIAIVFQGKDAASDDIRRVEQGLASVEKAGEGTLKVTDQLDGIAGKIGTIGAALLGAFGALSVGSVVEQFVAANVELEKFTRAITAISGSSATASRDLEYVRGVADRLGLDVRTAADAWVQLAAAAKGTSLEGEQSKRVFEAVSGAMSLLGKSSADTQGALLAVQQIISKGTVSSEELRGQLGERLPGAFQIAARAVGVTTEELGKMLEAGSITANEFLPKFAAELERTFGNSDHVDTYTAAVNRFRNAVELALQDIGTSAGGLSTALADSGAKVVTAIGAVTSARIEAASALLDVARGGSWDTFYIQLDSVEARLRGVGATLSRDLNQSLAETERLTRQAADATAAYGDETDAETARLLRQSSAQKDALNAIEAAYKTLGVKVRDSAEEFAKFRDALTTVANAADFKPDGFIAGFDAAIKKAVNSDQLTELQDVLVDVFTDGKISVEQYDKAFQDLLDTENKLLEPTKQATEEIRKQEEQARKAKEASERMRLELEKLASNERIKLIEVRAAIDVEQIKADTERVKAAFDSVNKTVENTSQVIEKAFGMLAGDQWLDSSVRNKLFEQIDIENRNRERALDLQAKLTEAQIEVLRQQADSLNRGDALIKVDGAGLQPHLEAFMWEILRAIQVRTNQDGLKHLLGV